jgi:hypothetical protein
MAIKLIQYRIDPILVRAYPNAFAGQVRSQFNKPRFITRDITRDIKREAANDSVFTCAPRRASRADEMCPTGEPLAMHAVPANANSIGGTHAVIGEHPAP